MAAVAVEQGAMTQAYNTVIELVMRDPVIVVMGIILLISYFADEIDRW